METNATKNETLKAYAFFAATTNGKSSSLWTDCHMDVRGMIRRVLCAVSWRTVTCARS
jgi:hypothetical protein